MITHFNGERLDFGLGRTLGTNYGIVAAGKDVHGMVLEAIKQANANGVSSIDNSENHVQLVRALLFHFIFCITTGGISLHSSRYGSSVIEWQKLM